MALTLVWAALCPDSVPQPGQVGKVEFSVAHRAREGRRANATRRRQHLDRKVAPNADPVLGPIFDSNLPATQWNIVNDWGHVLNRGTCHGHRRSTAQQARPPRRTAS